MSDFDYRTGDKIEINMGSDEWKTGIFESYKPFPGYFLCNVMQIYTNGSHHRMITNIPLNCIRMSK